jgi:hypothetical protein
MVEDQRESIATFGANLQALFRGEDSPEAIAGGIGLADVLLLYVKRSRVGA